LLTPEQKDAVIAGWTEERNGMSMMHYFKICGQTGDTVDEAKQMIIDIATVFFGGAEDHAYLNGVSARECIDAIKNGEFDQEIACYMGLN